jgi:hypothetical protein
MSKAPTKAEVDAIKRSLFARAFGHLPAVRAIERVCGPNWNQEEAEAVVTDLMPAQIREEELRKGWIEEK